MKRSADKQLTQDDKSDEEVEEVSGPAQGFKKANEAALASRPMKGMPKRGMSGSPASSPRSTPTPLAFANDAAGAGDTPPKFAGFGGFGAMSNPTPFSFTPPIGTSVGTPPSAPHAQSNVSNAAASVPSPSSPSPFASTSTILAASASEATKTFASFLSSSSNSSLSSSSSPATSAPSQQASKEDDEAFKYYSALRGLNVSFVAAVSKAVEADPFADVAEVLERYKTLRITVQKEFDGSSKTPVGDSAKSTSSVVFGSGSSSDDRSTPSAKPAIAMPVPPKTFGGFSSLPVPSATSMPSGSGFTPKLDSASSSTTSAFSFATPPSSSASMPAEKSPFAFGGLSTTTSLKANPFGSSNGGSKPTSVFGSSTGSTSSPFGSSSSTRTPSAFSGGAFSLSKPLQTDKNDSAAGPSNMSVFGGSGSGASLSNSHTSPTHGGSIGFGSFSSASSPGGGFGSKGSIGNPVGFSFGSPTPEPEPASAKSSAATGFPFAGSAASSEGKDDADIRAFSPATQESGDATPAEDDDDAPKTKLIGENPHDLEGEGESDEETTHSSRLKVYKLKHGDAGPEWGGLGVGILRLKKHKKTEKRRVLLRNSGNGIICINFHMYLGFKPTQSKNTVTFVGHDNGQKATFKLRLKDEVQAIELKTAMDREIALVKKKEAVP